MKTIEKIFVSAKEKELENVSVRIYESLQCDLYVGEKDRFVCSSPEKLLEAISKHEESLAWMNN